MLNDNRSVFFKIHTFIFLLLLFFPGLLVGVFDGHGGGACAQVIAKRLYKYITACLLPHDHLQRYMESLKTSTPLELIQSYNDRVQFVDDVRDIYKASFRNFLEDLSKVTIKKGFNL